MSSFENAWCIAVSHCGLSPTAVPMMQRRGCAPAPAILAARDNVAGFEVPGVAPVGLNPMLVAMMVPP